MGHTARLLCASTSSRELHLVPITTYLSFSQACRSASQWWQCHKSQSLVVLHWQSKPWCSPNRVVQGSSRDSSMQSASPLTMPAEGGQQQEELTAGPQGGTAGGTLAGVHICCWQMLGASNL